MNKNLILTYKNGARWGIPVQNIADHRAKYIAERDKDTSYEKEYEYAMGDDNEASDWFFTEMDWSDVKNFAFEIAPPIPFDPGKYDLSDSYLETE